MSEVSDRRFDLTRAESYERYFVPAIAMPFSRDLLEAAGLEAGESVVDVACGTGIIARLAAERVGPRGSVAGLDVDPDMVEVARSTSGDIDWRVADAGDMPFDDDTFDVVLCQMGLMFMEDRPGALAEMRRVLAPGGRLVLNTPGRIQPLFERMEEAIVEHISADLGGFVRAVFSLHDPEALGDLVRDAGFREVSTRESSVRLELPAPAEFLWQYINLTPMGPLVAQAPEPAKAAMEEDCVRSWKPYTSGGSTLIEQPAVTATART